MKDVKNVDLELINMIDHDTTKVFEYRIPRIYKREGQDLQISDDSLGSVHYYEQSQEKTNLKKINAFASFLAPKNKGKDRQEPVKGEGIQKNFG